MGSYRKGSGSQYRNKNFFHYNVFYFYKTKQQYRNKKPFNISLKFNLNMSELKFITQQFKNIYNDDNWLGETFVSVVEDVPSNIAFKKPEHSNNSIGAIVKHLVMWRDFFFKKFESDKNFDVDQEESFNVSEYKYSSGGWQQLLGEYEDSQNRLISILESADDEIMERSVGRRQYKMGYLINGLLQHDLYHLGQIILLKKQLVGK